MYKYALCEIFIPEKVHLSSPPTTQEADQNVAKILLYHIHEGTAEIFAFHKYIGVIESISYNEENDNLPGTYFLISIEMLGILWKRYKLRKKWQNHLPLILDLISREVSASNLPCKSLLESEREAHIMIVKDYD